MIGRDPPHYLRRLKSTTVPKRLLWLDCEHTSKIERGVTVDRWRSGMLGRTWSTSRRAERQHTMDRFDTPEELWRFADEFCHPNRRVVLFAHDLAYQLRVSQALVHLPALGWRLQKIVLEKQAAWCILRDNQRSLMCCDLMSWAPGSIEYERTESGRLGAVRDATLALLDWVEREELGQFRPTGSGQSYTAFRRRFMTHNILVHDDNERLHAERVAMWTGRCEAWKHGTLTDGPFVEYDMQAAYCRIAAECDVPIVARHTQIQPTRGLVESWMKRWAVLADVTITINVPVAPARSAGRTLWPVGTFRTWLWDPELSLVFEHADSVHVHAAYRYDRAPALRQFAQWTLDGMTGAGSDEHPIVRRALKHWSRCLVGRLGLRYRAWEKFGTQDDPDLRLVEYVSGEDGTRTDMLIAGNDRLLLADMSEALESVPQIPSWVMSECRRRLWEAMQSVGFENVVYCDTDSVIVEASRRHVSLGDAASGVSGTWTRKGRYSRVTIHAPRNIVCETDRRVSGLPLAARQVAPLEFSGQVMRSIKESMRAGELDCVASLPRSFTMDAPDMRREHLPNNQTQPFTVSLPARETEEDEA